MNGSHRHAQRLARSEKMLLLRRDDIEASRKKLARQDLNPVTRILLHSRRHDCSQHAGINHVSLATDLLEAL